MDTISKSYLRIFIASALGFSLLLSAFLIILDPYQILHKSFFYEDRYLSDGRYQNAGYINTLLKDYKCCDTLIIGTSHSQNFLPQAATDAFGGKGTLQLTMAGSLPHEQAKLIERALSVSDGVKRVIIGIHTSYAEQMLSSYRDENKKFFPDTLYDGSSLNDVAQVLSFDMLGKFSELTTLGKPYERARSWFDAYKPSFDKGIFLKGKHPDIKEKNFTPCFCVDFPNLDMILSNVIMAHPNIEFLLFIPPYSTHYYANISQEEFDRLMEMRLHLVGILQNQKNAKLFAFDTVFPETNNLDMYKDLQHYHEDMNTKILKWMADDKGRLTSQNILDRTKTLTQKVNAYIQFEKEGI